MTNQDALDKQITLIRSLRVALGKNSSQVQLHETHISWVLVTDTFAYKFKKAVHFDFLDFSTLAARHFYCQEELRLNRRLAPDLYLDVVAVTGDPEHPSIDDTAANPIEYAVRMRVFPQEALWSHRIGTGLISAPEIDALATKIARFHAEAPAASDNAEWGTPGLLQSAAEDNLAEIVAMAEGMEQKAQLGDICSWQSAQTEKLHGAFEHRKASRMIRECHGDLHGGNVLTVNDRVEVFDCIEFNESLRWIDVMNDISFIYMDLRVQGKHALAARLLNRYLEATGDYDGVAVLRYYQVQRALVRCKVALMRARQLRADAQDDAAHERQAKQYLDFSAGSIRPARAAIMIMHGFSGSGKSTLSEHLVEIAGAIRLRSDVERKRMHGLAPLSRAAAAAGEGLYDAAATQKTYSRLCMLARHVVESGMPVIVDASFLRKKQRRMFEDLAQALKVPFFIFELRASETALKERLAARAQLGQDPSDAGLAILAHQIVNHDALSDDELNQTIAVDTGLGMDSKTVERLAGPVVSVLQTGGAFS